MCIIHRSILSYMYWCQNSEKNTKFVRIKIDTMYGMHLVLVIYISLKKILASSKNISDGKYLTS